MRAGIVQQLFKAGESRRLFIDFCIKRLRETQLLYWFEIFSIFMRSIVIYRTYNDATII